MQFRNDGGKEDKWEFLTHSKKCGVTFVFFEWQPEKLNLQNANCLIMDMSFSSEMVSNIVIVSIDQMNDQTRFNILLIWTE